MNVNFILIGSLIVFTSFGLKAITGMGAALLCVPLLALIIDIRQAVPIELIFELIFGAILFFRIYREIQVSLLILVVLSALLGISVGTEILLIASESLLRIILSIVVFIFSLRIFITSNKERIGTDRKTSYLLGAICGFAGGSIGGITGQQGPPIALYLENQISDKTKLRSTLIAVFFINDLFRLFLYISEGIMNKEIFFQSLYFIPAIAAAVLVGNFFHFKIDETLIRRLIAIILIVSALIISYPVVYALF
ncbi:MAG: sulfite exporter TauE/SafE family protein [Candidatus Schekmanbacteria bacterium]|nr:MAG: sulfite exporter TauE/SafE family protein [Candidatus Schekmanbacteria bacterium]